MPRPKVPEFQDAFVPTPTAAEITGISEPALEQDRCSGVLGIPYYKFGTRVRYKLSELLNWCETKRVVPPTYDADDDDRHEVRLNRPVRRGRGQHNLLKPAQEQT
jgi:hypothetical protein